MRKLRRRAFNTLTVLSLLLCIATAGVWLRSYHHYFGIESMAGYFQVGDYAFSKRRLLLSVNRGALLAQSRYGELTDAIAARPWYFERKLLPNFWLDQFSYAFKPEVHTLGFAGFQLSYPRKREIGAASKDPGSRFANIYELVLPLWSLTLLFALLPSLSLLRLIRRRRIPPGHCRHCGYDLHANLSGTCPECGKPTAAAEPQRV